MQFQHKILRKYAMLGMIHFQAIPFFHQLVNDRDYKMICIFEVFAQNRNEDDFLENLGILNDIRLNNENIQESGVEEGGASDSADRNAHSETKNAMNHLNQDNYY